MYPQDNIFNIYNAIGKRLPFVVKRCVIGSKGSHDWDYRYSTKGRTYLVERVEQRGRYGDAYGKCFVNGEPDDSYRETCYPEYAKDESIPLSGCGEWVLIDVPGVDLNELFPIHKAQDIMPFGKYKGKTFQEVFETDPNYIKWLSRIYDKYFQMDMNSFENK